jgi:hypothetical protein
MANLAGLLLVSGKTAKAKLNKTLWQCETALTILVKLEVHLPPSQPTDERVGKENSKSRHGTMLLKKW